jgi:uridylate kinase
MSKLKRVLIKISGEMLQGSQSFGIDMKAVAPLATSIGKLSEQGIQIGLVIGGGNLFRGINLKDSGIPRSPADQMGMLATIMNGIALQQAFNSAGYSSLVMSALECPKVVEPYQWAKCNDALSNGKIVIFVGGTGNPYFTTDTAAALRASEINADALLKATKVNGIFSDDPIKNSNAQFYNRVTYSQILAEKLQVMDATSVALCRSNHIPIYVFNMNLLSNEKILNDLSTGAVGTLVEE